MDGEETDSQEQLLLSFFLLASGWMFVEAYNFPSAARGFPQITSGIVFIGSSVVLMKNYLPGVVQPLVTSTDVFRPDLGEAEDIVDEKLDDETRTSEPDRPIGPAIFSGVSVTGYIILAHLIGFLWATPVFVLFYTIWFYQPKIVVVGLTAISFIISILFEFLLNLGQDGGILHELLFEVLLYA